MYSRSESSTMIWPISWEKWVSVMKAISVHLYLSRNILLWSNWHHSKASFFRTGRFFYYPFLPLYYYATLSNCLLLFWFADSRFFFVFSLVLITWFQPDSLNSRFIKKNHWTRSSTFTLLDNIFVIISSHDQLAQSREKFVLF